MKLVALAFILSLTACGLETAYRSQPVGPPWNPQDSPTTQKEKPL